MSIFNTYYTQGWAQNMAQSLPYYMPYPHMLGVSHFVIMWKNTLVMCLIEIPKVFLGLAIMANHRLTHCSDFGTRFPLHFNAHFQCLHTDILTGHKYNSPLSITYHTCKRVPYAFCTICSINNRATNSCAIPLHPS